ncbi:hypothetical protein D3C80_1942510 [compost metagenome]
MHPYPFIGVSAEVGIGIHCPVIIEVQFCIVDSRHQALIKIQLHKRYAQPVTAAIDIIFGINTDHCSVIRSSDDITNWCCPLLFRRRFYRYQ